MAQAGGEGLGALFAFRPRDQDLVDLYLRPKIAGQPRKVSFIHDADLYSAAPEKLVAGREAAPGTGTGDKRVWYFYCPVRYAGKNGGGRKSRMVGGDGAKQRWHAETALKPVEGGGAGGGKFQKFSYQVGSAPGGFKPGGWLMTEYSVDGGGDLVLCKVYKSPRMPSSGSSSSSCTTTAAALSGAGRKRKAAGDHPPAPRRQTDEEEHDALFADDIERALTASSGGLDLDDGAASKNCGTHVLPGGEPPPCARRAETEDSLLCGDQLVSKNGGTMALPIVTDDDDDVDSFGGGVVLCRSPRSVLLSSCTTTASLSAADEDTLRFRFSDDPTPVPDDFDVLASSEEMEEGGEPAAPQCTPGAAAEEDGGPGSGTHGGEKIVFVDAGVSVDDLLDQALGERDGGLPCPEPATPCGNNKFFSASGNMSWDPTAGGRYELLSTYLPPSCRDEEDDDALRWSEATGTSRLFASAVDEFWGSL